MFLHSTLLLSEVLKPFSLNISCAVILFILGRHPFWTNIDVTDKEFKNIDISRSKPNELLTERGIDATIFDCIKDVPENRSKDNRFERLQLVRNMVNPEIGLHILKCAGW